ncbi:MAG: sugar phosphate isomerase/epimerase [Treponema sp.]|jgi:sugar phosphate isomerase/epimerase|nr:sugar phosphate isomerase/epimerase [Treponema sp.]
MYHIAMTQWITGDEDIETSCLRLKKYGYDGIEFAAEPHKLDAEECRTLMRKYGLDCRSLCGIFDENRDLTDPGDAGKNAVNYLRDSVDFAVKVGAKIIIVVPSPVGRTVQPAGKTLDELRNNAVKNIREAAGYAQKHGVRFAIEAINRYETYFANTLEKAWSLVVDIGHPAVGIMADLFHMSIEESSFTKSLLLIQDKLLHVHIADNTREPAGFGHIDFKEILRILKKIGYEGSLTMEFMYRLADPYSSKEIKTETGLMDRYAGQAIDYIKTMERSIDNS